MTEDKKTGPKAWYKDFHIRQDLQMYYTSYLSRALSDADAEIYIARVRTSPQRIWRELKAIGEEIQHSEEAAGHTDEPHKPTAESNQEPQVTPKKVKRVTPKKAATTPKKVKETPKEPAQVPASKASGIKQLLADNINIIIVSGVVIVALIQFIKS